jgi:TonB family protein
MKRLVLGSVAALMLAPGCATSRPARDSTKRSASPDTEVISDGPAKSSRAELAYFTQVKRKVFATWRLKEAFDRHDPEGSLMGKDSRSTILDVTIDASGRLKDVIVKKSSDLIFIDESAIQAFVEAQPFPEPPADSLDGTGEFRFTFGFESQPARSR